MDVEPATMDDLEWITEGWIALAEEQRGHGSHLRSEANREPIRMAMAAGIVDDRVLVVRGAEGRGFVQFEVEGGRFERDVRRGIVQNLYVEPGARNAGIGSALLDAAERALAESGVEVVVLDAMADNEPARRLYRRRGYRPHRIEYERRVESDTHSREGR